MIFLATFFGGAGRALSKGEDMEVLCLGFQFELVYEE